MSVTFLRFGRETKPKQTKFRLSQCGSGNVGLRGTRAKQETEQKMSEEKGIKRQC